MKFTGYSLQVTGLIAFILLLLFTATYPLSTAFAQTDLNAAYNYNVVDPQAQDGDILIYTSQGLTRAASVFSTAIFGVMQANPIVVIDLGDNSGSPVVKSGVAQVNVTGPVKKGDYVTSSAIPGKGQRADKSGYMLGIALADASGDSDKITVALDIKYVDLYSMLSPNVNKFLKSLDNILLASTQDPEKFTKLVRYIAATIIVLGAFIISFFTFSRSMTNSVEAIGRNPLAKNPIYVSLVINIVVTVFIVLAGLATAFILIKL